MRINMGIEAFSVEGNMTYIYENQQTANDIGFLLEARTILFPPAIVGGTLKYTIKKPISLEVGCSLWPYSISSPLGLYGLD